ncbi:MAG: hypothetical protein PVF70_12080 [Anaerolineales bacterium]|jgi:hypothetical protein
MDPAEISPVDDKKAEIIEVEMQEPSEEAEPKPPSALTRFLRKALRWAIAIAVAYILGLVTIWLASVRPMKAEIRALQDSLDQSEEHVTLLGILTDVTSAQLALSDDDVVAAKAALTTTGDRLASLEGTLVDTGDEFLARLQDRLSDVMRGLDGNRFAAERDLEVLANDILEWERALFGR